MTVSCWGKAESLFALSVSGIMELAALANIAYKSLAPFSLSDYAIGLAQAVF